MRELKRGQHHGITIFIVRHGETDDNGALILHEKDERRDERGISQAERLAQRLSACGFVHILCSDLLRALTPSAKGTNVRPFKKGGANVAKFLLSTVSFLWSS